MGDLRKQDAAAGLHLTMVGTIKVPAFDPGAMLRVCTDISNGELLKEITKKEGYPSITTVRQWIMTHPPAARAYEAALAFSAMDLEEQALLLGKQIRREPGTSQKVRAYEVAMNQLRWSASRRNPGKFGEQAKASIVVPVQIITSMPMGEGSVGAGTEEHPNIYQIDAKIPVGVEDVVTETAQRDPDAPFVPVKDEYRKGPRRKVLVAPEATTPQADLKEKAAHRAVMKEKKRVADQKRMRETIDEYRRLGGPHKTGYREMKKWIAEHQGQEPSGKPSALVGSEQEDG